MELEAELKHNETYAIYNKKLHKFVCGSYRPKKQILSNNCLLTYDWIESAETDMRCRRCGKDYKVVKIKIEVITDEKDNKLI